MNRSDPRGGANGSLSRRASRSPECHFCNRKPRRGTLRVGLLCGGGWRGSLGNLPRIQFRLGNCDATSFANLVYAMWSLPGLGGNSDTNGRLLTPNGTQGGASRRCLTLSCTTSVRSLGGWRGLSASPRIGAHTNAAHTNAVEQ